MVLTVRAITMNIFSGKLSSVEETKAHVIILLGLRLGLLGSSSSWSSFGSSRGGSSCELAGVGQELLQGLRLLEGDVRDGGHGEEVLHAVDDAVGDRGDGRVVDGETHGGNIGHSGHELGLDVIIRDVQDLGVEDGAVFVDLLDEETIGEGRNLQHVEKGGLGGANLVPSLDDRNVLDDLMSRISG